MKKIMLILSAPLILLLGLLACAQHRVVGLYEGDQAAQAAQADAVAAWAEGFAGAQADSPGSAFFDAEWSFGTCTMVVMGLGQVVLEHPELKERYLPGMEACLDWLMLPESRAFGSAKWDGDGLERPGLEAEHAYLGYLDLALGMHRMFEPESRYARAHDVLSAALAARLAAPIHRFRTYPRESYPVDQAVCAGAVGLHGLATGTDHSERLADWEARFRDAAVDSETGWLYQRLDSEDGFPSDRPRGSGTALAAYALLYAAPDLSAELYVALAERGLRAPLGLGVLREYPPGIHGRGDIDSGPVILGFGVSATGFAMAGARAHGDARAYRRIGRTAALFGLPGRRHGGRWYWAGGAIGNAIMLAMHSAPVVAQAPDS